MTQSMEAEKPKSGRRDKNFGRGNAGREGYENAVSRGGTRGNGR